MDKSRIELMEHTPVRTAILKLGVPTMLAMVVQLIYNMTDTFFVGMTGDPNLVAAVSLAAPIFMSIHAIGSVFANGTSSYVSRQLGAKNFDEARHANAVAFYNAAVLGLVITAVTLVFLKPLLSVIGTSPATYQPTVDYMVVIAVFSVIQVLQIAMTGMVRSEGATGKATIGMVLGIGLNIVLDPLFILTFKMGVAGAAWATIIGNLATMIYFIIHFLGKKTLLSIRPKDFRPSGRIYAETLKIGVPSSISMLVFSFSMILVNIVAAGYGDHVVAGNGIQMRVTSMAVMLVMGLAMGFQPFAGYNYGARRFDRLKEGFVTTIVYGTVVSVVFTVIFIIFGDSLIGLFIRDEATKAAGVSFLQAYNWCVPFFGIQMTLMVTFQSTGKAMKSMVVSLGRQCVIYLPMLFILNSMFGFDGFVFAQPVAEITTTVVAVMMSLSFLKEMTAREETHGAQSQAKLAQLNPEQS